jgi:hypothetical protein
MRDITLEIPLCFFSLRRCTESDHPANPWVETLRDSLDRAALARCVPPFEKDHDSQPLVAYPFLKLDQFDLQPAQLAFVAAVPAEGEGLLLRCQSR